MVSKKKIAVRFENGEVIANPNILDEYKINMNWIEPNYIFRGVSSKEDFSDIENPQQGDVVRYEDTTYFYTGEKWEKFGDLPTGLEDNSLADELMIHDWFYADGVKKQFESTDHCPEEFGYFIDKYEPIRLTHKILSENLDYENQTDDGRYYSILDSTVWGVFDKGVFYLCFNGQQDMIEIKYVHQLQQAFRLMGLKDKANYFKV